MNKKIYLNKLQIGFLLSVILFIIFNNTYANNIIVTNVSLQKVDANYADIKFNLAWENSWRTSSAPNNYDAAWIFIKYKKTIGWGNNQWEHVNLNSAGHFIPAGFASYQPADNKGIFIHRSLDGNGTVTLQDVKLRWNTGIIGLNYNDAIEVKVFAIEMVYIPQSSFYVGDGTTQNIEGQFTAHNTSSNFLISGEGQLTLGGIEEGNLGNNNSEGMLNNWEGDGRDDFNNDITHILPAAFPKGFNAFYIMKYEITQQNYVDFLNTLSSVQAAERCSLNIVVTNRFRYEISVNSNHYRTANPYVACNFLQWKDLAAFFDWSALRPMTELEFEKACRGPLNALPNEYAWGSADVIQVTGIVNSGANNETASPNNANCVFGDVTGGPLRTGFAAKSNSTRITSGASYYGVMELSGNLWERIVTVGRPEGRNFTGNHGDGILLADGNANVDGWPSVYTTIGIAFRGGNWFHSSLWARVSSRYYSAYAWNGYRHARTGGRGVRSAE